ncbi:hypothetical protein AAHA92_32026 [Salvia divinorum]|uniref:Uncharacterized protein n=1 Tax=Salvia divinorum TaxID=28513 RepID=A0ABD1FJD4_SALDI
MLLHHHLLCSKTQSSNPQISSNQLKTSHRYQFPAIPQVKIEADDALLNRSPLPSPPPSLPTPTPKPNQMQSRKRRRSQPTPANPAAGDGRNPIQTRLETEEKAGGGRRRRRQQSGGKAAQGLGFDELE